MATMSPNTLITTKVLINGTVRRFKIQIKDLGANTLPGKLKELLIIPQTQDVIFERYSDSAGQYIVLDSNKPAVYKQLYRAAKAKLKLRIKVTFPDKGPSTVADLNSNSALSSDPTPPAYASQATLPVYPNAPEPVIAASEPVVSNQEPQVPLEEVVTNAVAAYLDGEEGRTKLRVTIGEEVEKKMADQKKLFVTPNTTVAPTGQAYAVYCNFCEKNVEDTHYHCGICDQGDFDLCQSCFTDGKHCKNESHWMIKRMIRNGEIIISTTESVRIQKKKINEPEVVEDVDCDRFCNACCNSFTDDKFVECTVCPDYDLCIECHTRNDHAHHPAHAFKPAVTGTSLSPLATSLLPAGRNFRHFAVCDGCDKQIYGVRHKCLKCPDWDYCSSCINSAHLIHPGHRFVPVYDALKLPPMTSVRHYGIYCDGLLCKTRRCIVGDRYKCAICPDFDLCSMCEASPSNAHNPTHPLIKFKTAIRHVTVQTLDDSATDKVLGDEVPAVSNKNTSPTSNAATQVQTVADIEPLAETASTADEKPATTIEKPKEPEELKATFIRETIHDGTVFEPGTKFTQTWTLYNKGDVSWPAGVSIKFTGGDSLFEQILHNVSSEAECNATVTKDAVQVASYIDFSVNLVAPATSRQQIGYWRLVAPDGTRFGPNLWCDIRVAEPRAPSPEPVPESTPGEDEISAQPEVEVQPEAKTTQIESPAQVEGDLLIDSHSSQMIFPKLDKESPVPSASNSTANLSENNPTDKAVAAPVQAPSSPSTLSSGEFDDVASETLSYVDEDLENEFISDDEDYEVLMPSEDDEDYKNL